MLIYVGKSARGNVSQDNLAQWLKQTIGPRNHNLGELHQNLVFYLRPILLVQWDYFPKGPDILGGWCISDMSLVICPIGSELGTHTHTDLQWGVWVNRSVL